MGKGVWIDGMGSEEEIELLQAQIRRAVLLFRQGKLPYHYRGSKLDFHATAKGSDLHVFYGWNFPPLHLWSREEKDKTECLRCAVSDDGTAQREIWCEKIGYNFPKCPYGVITRAERDESVG